VGRQGDRLAGKPTTSVQRSAAEDAQRQDHARLLREVALGGEVHGDTTTLEDLSVITRCASRTTIRPDEAGARAGEPDPDLRGAVEDVFAAHAGRAYMRRYCRQEFRAESCASGEDVATAVGGHAGEQTTVARRTSAPNRSAEDPAYRRRHEGQRGTELALELQRVMPGQLAWTGFKTFKPISIRSGMIGRSAPQQ